SNSTNHPVARQILHLGGIQCVILSPLLRLLCCVILRRLNAPIVCSVGATRALLNVRILQFAASFEHMQPLALRCTVHPTTSSGAVPGGFSQHQLARHHG